MSTKEKEVRSPHEPLNEATNEVKSHSSTESEEEKVVKKDKYDRGGKHPIVGLIVYSVLQFIALLLVVVATPISMYKMNDGWRDKLYPELASSSKQLCVSAWGMKLGCNQKGYHNRDFTSTFCYRVRVNFKIVEAFCIMTIGFMVFGLVMGILSIFQKVGKGATGSIGTFAMVLCVVPWGIIAGMYYQKPCCETTGWGTNDKSVNCRGNNTNIVDEDIPGFKDMGSYAAGFGLLVAAWAIQVVAIVFAFVPM
ncbi:amastin-like protein [Leptomonas seymouri]|uniref:Amastin-like protein n=1 Tax=Leptomonas seymouri TaxID=5684 RepID=A0A0N1PAD5_LEPSE|nr:amastin-like protein [Leptomonas seymouri]|eukprot:KPI84070.1 amastin-like protein [Leptomonas seymouri]